MRNSSSTALRNNNNHFNNSNFYKAFITIFGHFIPQFCPFEMTFIECLLEKEEKYLVWLGGRIILIQIIQFDVSSTRDVFSPNLERPISKQHWSVKQTRRKAQK
jgi:hypothetical protein